MTTTITSAHTVGVTGQPVTIECELVRRLPSVVIVGLPAAACRETAERVRSAITASGCDFPRKRVVVNVSPNVRRGASGLDLAIAVAILTASGDFPGNRLRTAFIGELSLSGDLRPVRGIIAAVTALRDAGIERVVVPAEQGPDAALVEGIIVLGATSLHDVVKGTVVGVDPARSRDARHTPDFSDVVGHEEAIAALEDAAVTGQSVLLIGPPGSGKTLLACRLPSILPPLTPEEALEVTSIRDAAGLQEPGAGLVTRRPFRAPHHTVSVAGLIGTASLRPGEVTLAHRGVLFLDELPEFGRPAIEAVRRVVQDKWISVARADGTTTLPADLQLLAAASPCPCGWAGTTRCTCGPELGERYRARIPFDLFGAVIQLRPLSSEEVLAGDPNESSAAIRERVVAARAR